jgi:hypothetical protein
MLDRRRGVDWCVPFSNTYAVLRIICMCCGSSDFHSLIIGAPERAPVRAQAAEPVMNRRSQPNQADIPAPVRALTGKIVAVGLTSRTRAR